MALSDYLWTVILMSWVKGNMTSHTRHNLLRLLFRHSPFARVEAYLEGGDDLLANIVMELENSSNLPL